MFGQNEYDRYVRLQECADRVWRECGDGPEYEEAQAEADAAYEAWEYATGIKRYED